MLTYWLHLTALVVYLGSVVGFWVMLYPILSVAKSHEQQVTLLVRSLKLYNPTQIGALGLVVISGAVQLTDLKAAYREEFFKELGSTLGLKLTLSFLLIIFSTYQSMGVGLRFVRRYEGGDPISPQDLRSIGQRLKALAPAIVFLAIITLWLGMRSGG